MNSTQKLIALTIVAAGSLFSGCANRGGILGVDCCADIPAGAIPEPAGNKVCNWQTAQVANAIADQAVLYQADFISTTDQLSPAALDRMSRHAQSNLANVLPWVVEPSGEANLDASRIASALTALSARGVTPIDIQIATPAALGLSGPQAEGVARNSGNNGNSSGGTGAPTSRPSGLGGLGNAAGGRF